MTRRLAIQGRRCWGSGCWSDGLFHLGWVSGKAVLTAGLLSQDLTSLPPVKTNAAAGLQPHVRCSDYKAATPVLKMHHPLYLHCKDLEAAPK